MPSRSVPLRLSRRGFLLAGGAVGAGLLLPACGRRAASVEPGGTNAAGEILLVARPSTVELAGKKAKTWTFDGRLPGPEIRVKQGQRVRVRIENKLPEATSIHWHGIRLANAMDGVPGLTQEAIAPGSSFLYDFEVPDAGTFMFHPHVELQIDRGLYGALIVDAAREPLAYDREAVVLLDDWMDGVDGTPDARMKNLLENGMDMDAAGMAGMDGMGMGGGSRQGNAMNGFRLRDPAVAHVALDGSSPPPGHLAALAAAMEDGKVDSGDVQYPLYLMNGKPPKDPFVQEVGAGDRLRLRLINIAGDTLFLFFVEGHELTVTHADGAPVQPVVTDGLVLGMGERYDVMIQTKAGEAGRLIAMPLGKTGSAAVGVLRQVGSGAAPDLKAPIDLPARIASYADLRDAEAVEAPKAPTDLRADLAMDPEQRYAWSIGGKRGHESSPIEVGKGETIRLAMRNETTMPHPMHLHGHYFRAVLADGLGARKDTMVVPPMTETVVQVVADNPGRWAFHCHNIYHQIAGMERELRVT